MDTHSLHSPFVFNLYGQCLKGAQSKVVAIDSIEKIRHELKNDRRKIEVGSLGTASTLKKNKHISSIARHGISGIERSKVLCRLIEYFQYEQILELGTSLGINSLYLSSCPSVKRLITVEGNPELAAIAKSNFERLHMDGAKILCSEALQAFKPLLNQKEKFDFIFIDANHSKEATLEYFDLSNLMLSDGGIIVLDDINWSKGMSEAWREIKANTPHYLKVENYQFGIIFSGTIQSKGTYILDF